MCEMPREKAPDIQTSKNLQLVKKIELVSFYFCEPPLAHDVSKFIWLAFRFLRIVSLPATAARYFIQ